MTVRAKVVCNSVMPVVWDKEKGPAGVMVRFGGVYSDVPGSENKAFTDASPSIDFQIMIAADKPAASMFKQGQAYYADFTEAPK